MFPEPELPRLLLDIDGGMYKGEAEIMKELFEKAIHQMHDSTLEKIIDIKEHDVIFSGLTFQLGSKRSHVQFD